MRKIVLIMVLLLLMPLSEMVHADNGGYIVKFNTDISSITDASEFKVINEKNNLYLIDDMSIIKQLSNYIVYCEENEPLELIEDVPIPSLFTVPEDESYYEQWQLQMINADYAWEFETFGNGVNVAVIDTGCNKHIELADNLAGGYNYVSNNEDFSDNHGHGTHVCGIIGAKLDDVGIAGIAPKANIYALKCVDAYIAAGSDILATAIYDAVDKYNCKVINMSLGIKNDKQSIRDAVEYALSQNVIIIASVGNNGNDIIYYPAGYDGVIGVGSVGQTKEKSYFSQVNESVFVVAPGENVKSLTGAEDYVYKGGTSQAAPLVAGIAAVMLSANPQMTINAFHEYIKSTSEDLGDTGYDTSFGYGLIDEKKILNQFFKENPYYISPINNGNVLIYNGSNETMNAIGIWAEYDAEKYIRGKTHQITLPPEKKYKINYEQTKNKVKYLLWSSLQNMKPLSIVREDGK